MSIVRFGIIGTGNIARIHAAAIHNAHGANLIAVYGRSKDHGQHMAEKYNITYEDNLDCFLQRNDIDAVTIATPSGTHAHFVRHASQAKKHILCEKPLDVTIEKVDQMIRDCAQHHVILACVFQARLNKNIAQIRSALQAGRFGKLVLANVQVKWYRDQAYYDSAGWRGTWDLDGGGVLMNQAIHAIDLLCHLAGKPRTVYAITNVRTHQRIEVEDTAAAVIHFANGALGTIEASTCCAPGFSRRLELSGEHGSIVLEDDRLTRWSFTNMTEEDDEILSTGIAGDNLKAGKSDPNAISHDGHRRLIEDLAHAISNKCEPAVPGREGRDAVSLICGIYESVNTGYPVHFESDH